MIQLFLDGRPAIPTDNSTIKLTVENPYFTKSTSYTYDVDLPLDIAENRQIFGFIDRLDVTKKAITLQARLLVDNICVLAGTAHVTSVSESSVKVQLLGSAASYNYGNKMDKTYIDELDLGNWYLTTWPDRSVWIDRSGKWGTLPDDHVFDRTSAEVFNRAKYNASGSKSDKNLVDAMLGGILPWVAFPTLNSSAAFECNGIHFRPSTPTGTKFEPFFRGYEGERPNHRTTDIDLINSGAIQPFVWVMAAKIAEATGFELRNEDNALYTNSFFKKIFIVNTNNYSDCNKCLPHWTVNEWWTQLENTFGVVMSVDYDAGRITLMQRKDHYEKVAGTVYLGEIVDEHNAELEDETSSDISVSNVGFADFDCAKYELLSEFILNSADRNSEFADLAALNAWANTQTDEVKESMRSTLFECKDGRRYVYMDDDSSATGFVEVDMYRPRINRKDSDDIDVELKFVPARYVSATADFYRAAGSGIAGGAIPEDKPIGEFPVTILSAQGISAMDWYKGNTEKIDLEAILMGDQEEGSVNDSRPDVIYMAIFSAAQRLYPVNQTLSNGQTVNDNLPYPRPLLREYLAAKLGGPVVNEDAPMSDSLSLIPIEGQNNLAANTVTGSVSVDTTVRQCVRFIADEVPDPSAIFIIRNRRFVCEKIEADIAVTGFKRLMTGYFYEFG